MTVGAGQFAVLGAIMFAIGVVGVLARRHPLAVLIGLCCMLAAPVIALVGFTHVVPESHLVGPTPRIPPLGDALAVITIVAATCAASLGFALIVLLWRRTGRADIDALGDLEG